MDRRQFIRQGTLAALGGLFGVFRAWRTPAQAAPLHRPSARPRIALIIDDIGFSRARARDFLEIGLPMTYAVLPRLTHSRELAAEISGRGLQVMLHQPMEPFNGSIDPGPGAVFVKDDPDRITATVMENLEGLPWAVGVNNHMGSRFTASSVKMSQVLPVIRDRGLFFVDSVTSGRSKAFRTAQRLHMPAACRNVFLDNRVEEDRILKRLDELLHYARTHGRAVGIGHPHLETARALACFADTLAPDAVDFVPVSEILKPPPA
jgi:polysaccharide deacetylase 2 family uncharacterized protein YibQ